MTNSNLKAQFFQKNFKNGKAMEGVHVFDWYIDHMKTIYTHNSSQMHLYIHVQACMCVKSLEFSDSLWPHGTVARQAPLFKEFSRQEHWSGLPCPPPGESSQPRDRSSISYVSCNGRCVAYHSHHLGSPLQFSSVQSFSHVRVSATPWTQHTRLPCPAPIHT